MAAPTQSHSDERHDPHRQRGGAVGVGLALEGQVHVLAPAGADRRRADRLARGPVELQRRRVHLAAVDAHVGLEVDLGGAVDRAGALVGDRVAAGAGRLARLDVGDVVLARVRLRRHEGDGDHHHADVHDHAAVGPAHQAPPALAPGGQHHLAAAPRRRRTRRGRRRAAGSRRRRRRPRPARRRPTPHHAGQNSRWRSSSVDALRHGSTGATAIRNSRARPDRRGHPVEVGPPDRDAAVLHRLDRRAGRPCRAARRRRTRRTARCWRGRRPRATAASRSSRASAAGRRASAISAIETPTVRAKNVRR